MSNHKYTDDAIKNAFIECNQNATAASHKLGMSRAQFNTRAKELGLRGDFHSKYDSSKTEHQNRIKEKQVSGQWVIETNHSRINTIDDIIKELNIDTTIWRVKSFQRTHWDTTMKIKSTDETDKPFIVQNSSLRAVFERIISEDTEKGINELLQRIESKSIPRLPVKRLIIKNKSNRALEIGLLDPHYGMRCFAPASNGDWTPEICRRIMVESVRQLATRSALFGPFQEIVLPLGNDFFHVDSLWHVTTRGTSQPEADAFHHSFESGEYLAVEIVEEVKSLFPNSKIKLYFIPGNHDRTSSFMLGRILNAYYKNDKNVLIDASSSPYKFWEYGVNLIGFEHGNSINAIRMAALMANEMPEAWSRTKFREWHLGDQHRKGSSKPSMLEEQGVSIEYLPSITMPNEWHKIKSFNHQKRGSVAFVWSEKEGQIARVQSHLDGSTNNFLGIKK